MRKKGHSYQNALAMFIGIVLIAIMVPCLQWLDRGSIRNPMETFALLPIAVALITAIMVINVILKFLTNFNIIPKQSTVIIYIMLSISIPFCSIGLMRGFYWGVSIVSMQYTNWKTNIVKSVYEIQDPSFFPKLSDDDYQDFHSLKEQIENIESENENLKSQLNNLVEPFDKFFFGTYSNDDVNEQFKKTGWDLLDQAIRISSTLPWSIWLSPIKNWIIFFILVFIIALLFTHFFFRDWVEKENLAFPLAQIPLVIIRKLYLFYCYPDNTNMSQPSSSPSDRDIVIVKLFSVNYAVPQKDILWKRYYLLFFPYFFPLGFLKRRKLMYRIR